MATRQRSPVCLPVSGLGPDAGGRNRPTQPSAESPVAAKERTTSAASGHLPAPVCPLDSNPESGCGGTQAPELSPNEQSRGGATGICKRTQGLDIRRAVITGPTGTLGIHLIFELISHGVTVYPIYRPGSPRATRIPDHPLVIPIACAMEDYESLPQQIGEQAQAFFHFAWDGAYGAAREDLPLQQKNIDATLAAVRGAAGLGCRVFIGAGSQSEYGHVDGVLTPELPCHPVTGYGAAKLRASQQSLALCQALGIRQNWCRILSLYGPYDGSHTMVMSLISTLLRGERPKCTPGDQIWDYLYAKDAARAFHLVAQLGADHAIYCLGGGVSQPLKTYIQAIRDAVNPDLQIGFGELPYYPNQVMHLEADISSLTRDTGFLPQYSFEQGIAETVAWVRENGDA